jgi:hypothetical protein
MDPNALPRGCFTGNSRPKVEAPLLEPKLKAAVLDVAIDPAKLAIHAVLTPFALIFGAARSAIRPGAGGGCGTAICAGWHG